MRIPQVGAELVEGDAVMASTMRAWAQTRRGEPVDVLHLVSLPIPDQIPPGHVLVRVSHCGLNPTTLMMIRHMPNLLGRERVVEMDFAGTVVHVGDAGGSPGNDGPSQAQLQHHLGPGTRVFGALAFEKSTSILALLLGSPSCGALAEYVVVPRYMLCVIPQPMLSSEAAGLATAGCTAIRFLDYSNVQAGGRVLINGASGGVGSFLVQLAKDTVGASGLVVAICSSKNVELVKKLGADDVVPYDKPGETLESSLTARYGGSNETRFDAVIDTVGVQSVYDHCPAYLKEGRLFLNMGVLPYMNMGWWGALSFMVHLLNNFWRPAILGGTPRTYKILSTEPNIDMMQRIQRLVDEGKINPLVDSLWPLQDTIQVSVGSRNCSPRLFWAVFFKGRERETAMLIATFVLPSGL